MFKCDAQFCALSFSRPSEYIHHMRLHPTLTTYACGYQSCTKVYSSILSLSSHLYKAHTPADPKLFTETACSSTIPCIKKFNEKKDLMAHLRLHLKQGTEVTCPFNAVCGRTDVFLSESCFQVHMSRMHSNLPFTSVATTDQQSCFEDDISDPEHVDGASADFKQPMNEYLAKALLTLEVDGFQSRTNMQSITNVMQNLLVINNEQLSKQCRERLCSNSVMDSEKANDFVKDLFSQPPLVSAFENFSSSYRRAKEYKRHVQYVEPKTIYLGTNSDGDRCQFQYVPLLDSIADLMSSNYTVPVYDKVDNHVIKDISTAEIVQKQIFIDNPESIGVILFQDIFEICNPLGSAKNIHKLLGVYCTLANIPQEKRCRQESIRLVILCKSQDLKEFGKEKVFQPVIADLLRLEAGHDAGDCTLKGSLVLIAGDNLGSNDLAGYLESFNTEYYCRHCISTKQAIKADIRGEPVMRTEDNSKVGTHGVVYPCVFDELEHFESTSGFPPCIAHDLFEGIVQYDLLLLLVTFIAKGYFTLKFLNSQIRRFPFQGSDARTKPKRVKLVNINKLRGTASEMWALLRFLPLLVGSTVPNDCSYWSMFLMLHEIAELLMSSKMTMDLISRLEFLLTAYLSELKTAFPDKFKPKHHFLTHYPWFISKFGPPMYYWTMHFEQEHGFYKKAIRHSPNFKNVCLTLAAKRQLKSAHLGIKEHGNERQMLAGELNTAVLAFLTNVRKPWDIILRSVLYNGQSYEIGDAVCTHVDESMPSFAAICCILSNQQGALSLLVQECHSIFDDHFRFFELILHDRLTLIDIKEIKHYKPLSIYTMNHKKVVCLKHGIRV